MGKVIKANKATERLREIEEVREYRNSLVPVFEELDGVTAETIEHDQILIVESNGDRFVLTVSKP